MKLVVHPGDYSIWRGGEPPVPQEGFAALIRDADGWSLIGETRHLPEGAEKGWRWLELPGPFGFFEVGVLGAILAPLAATGLSVLAVSSFARDHVFVREEKLGLALDALREAAFEIVIG